MKTCTTTKTRGYSHWSVAFAHCNLYAAAACPAARTERTPNPPRAVHRRGVVLVGNAQAVFAMLRDK